MTLRRIGAETESDAERFAGFLARDVQVETADHEEFPFQFTVLDEEVSEVVSNAESPVAVLPFQSTTVVDERRRGSWLVNGIAQLFVQRKRRANWALNDYPLLAHPWVLLSLGFIELGLLADIIWYNTFDTLPILLVLVVTWGVHSVFSNPHKGESVLAHFSHWLGRLSLLPFRRPSGIDALVVLVTLGVMFGTSAAADTVVTALQTGSENGHALVDTISPSTVFEAVLLPLLFAVFGVAEEVIFRHRLQRRTFSGMNVHRRVWLTGTIFGVAHVFVYGVSVQGLTTLVALSVTGAALGYSYEFTDNLTVPAAAHALNNFIAITAILLTTGAL